MPQLPPMPQMPVEQPEIDYNIEQNLYNYTFNLPTFPTIPYMPKPEAAPKPKKVKEEPVPEVPKAIAPVETEIPEELEPPTMPAQPLPTMPPPAQYTPYCVPVTGLLPGTGLPFGYHPVPEPCPPYPVMPGVPYGAPSGMLPTAVSPAGYGGMPEIPATPFPTPIPAASPQMMMDDDEGDEMVAQNYPGPSPMGSYAAPLGPMPMPMSASGGDCGCGGPKITPNVSYGPTAAPGIGAAPAPTSFGGPQMGGYGAVPSGYGAVPQAGFNPTQMGYVPAPVTGYSPTPVGYGGPIGGYPVSPGYGVAPTPGFGQAPLGYGVAPSGYGSAQGPLTQANLPYGPYQPSPLPTVQPLLRDEEIEDDDDDKEW